MYGRNKVIEKSGKKRKKGNNETLGERKGKGQSGRDERYEYRGEKCCWKERHKKQDVGGKTK